VVAETPAFAGRRARTAAVLVEATPLLGVPVWALLLVTHPNDYAYMFVLFMPGLVMLGTALVAALAVTLIARRGFVRSHAAGSLRLAPRRAASVHASTRVDRFVRRMIDITFFTDQCVWQIGWSATVLPYGLRPPYGCEG
jgi:hypothetical protein